MEWQIAELQIAAELDFEDQRAKIAVVPGPASESPEITGADQMVAIADVIADIQPNIYVLGLECSRKQ